MNIAWLVFLALLLAVIALLAWKTREKMLGGKTTGLVVSLLAAAILASRAHAWYASAVERTQAQAQLLESLPREGRPGGYVSSDKCQACHPLPYSTWHRTFHRTMTQYASPQAILAPFDGRTLEAAGQTFRVERRGDEFWVDLEDPEWHLSRSVSKQPPASAEERPARVRRRVGLLTGSHHMQVYWLPTLNGNEQYLLPFSYLIEDRLWVPFKDTFLRDPKAPPEPYTWNFSCIQCHATGGQPQPASETGRVETRAGELGIACEACHGPAADHVRANQDPLRRYALHAKDKAADPTIVNPKRLSAKLSSQVCGQCHGIKWVHNKDDWKLNGFRYRPGDDLDQSNPIIRPNNLEEHFGLKTQLSKRPAYLDHSYWSDGMVRVIGREFSGLLESACHQRGDLTCLHCHSMHESDPDDQLAERMQSNEACLQCHKQYRDQLESHTHHKTGSAGSACYNCHMPHTTYGLLKAIHSHWIDSPTVESSVRTGRPNACNLCHLDKSLGWTAKHLGEWTGRPAMLLTEEQEQISAAVSWLLRGDAGQRALIAWHLGWDAAKAASGEKWMAPYLAVLLEDPYSAVRFIAQRSLKLLPGFSGFQYDFVGPESDRKRARETALQLWKESHAKSLDRSGPGILLEPDGTIDARRVERLLEERDDRSMDLQE